ncbi:catalase [Apiospora kogelbergensis]|uniref:Catalase n=1 Tax=Apiospora kogelbergensis TaxID=1337665 RepID=A0AAW0QFJ8_9PEZI
MDNWEETVLSSRHIHNRIGGRAGKSKAGDKSHGGGAFDVRKSFGTYEVKVGKGKQASSSKLEILRLTVDGKGVIGDLRLEGALTATVLMAGSRKALNIIVNGLAEANVAPGEATGLDILEAGNGDVDRVQSDNTDDSGDPDVDGTDGYDAGGESQPREERQQGRLETFEKNSFRSPKFWLRFQGHSSRPDEAVHSGSGYLVFSGNDCRKFDGTISCDALSWDNKKVTGWKTISRSERDIFMLWNNVTVR